MSAADTSPSRPSMIAKYATGTTTVTTRLTNVTFSSNGTAASSLRLTRCQKCLTSRTVKGSRHGVNYLLLRDGAMRGAGLCGPAPQTEGRPSAAGSSASDSMRGTSRSRRRPARSSRIAGHPQASASVTSSSRLSPTITQSPAASPSSANSVENMRGAGFTAPVSSLETGAVKPAPRMFSTLFALLGEAAGDCVMVGDSLEDDVTDAEACGCPAILLDRAGRLRDLDVPRIESLAELPAALGLPSV